MARRFNGTVVSDKMDKTVVVAVTRSKRHPLYRKKYQVVKKFVAHDEDNTYKPGDTVQIVETRPMSRRKRWLVEKRLKQAAEDKS
jgi:small subunit ribosomal protein S17